MMTVRNEDATSYTEQEYYPYIHLFYHLAFSGQLLKKETVKGGKTILAKTERARDVQGIIKFGKVLLFTGNFLG